MKREDFNELHHVDQYLKVELVQQRPLNEYSYLQMSVNSNPANKSQQKCENLEPKIGTSTYVVNNSLVCCLRPKRASFDIKLYLQLHKKLTRRAVIERKFEESVYQFSNPNQYPRQGFKGKRRPQSFISKSHSLREKEKRVYTEETIAANETTDNWSNSHWNALSRQADHTNIQQTSLNSRVKPNMMYNLSLYRKGFKHSSLKREKMCLTIMQSIQRTKRERTQQKRERNTRSSKAHTTIS